MDKIYNELIKDGLESFKDAFSEIMKEFKL
jgi:hypothetical protein